MERIRTGDARHKLRKIGPWVVGLFWLVQFAELTVIASIEGAWFALHILPERVLVVSIGMALSILLVEIAVRVEHLPFRRRLTTIVLAALLLSGALVTAAYQIAQLGIGGRRPFDLAGFVALGFTWSWFFLSVAVAVLALSFNLEVREREDRLAALEIVAQDAKLAALRYQLNPHFLFNTLNSIAALIGKGERAGAERMVENLADFLRTTLELEPSSEVTLEREVELQAMYLAIEAERFQDRLVARYDVPAGLRKAMVPALISQPLVENAIRHAVARSLEPVTVTIAARATTRHLQLSVTDDAQPAGTRPRAGTGLGIANVRTRLETLFGSDQSLVAVPNEDRGFRSEIELPLRLDR